MSGSEWGDQKEGLYENPVNQEFNNIFQKAAVLVVTCPWL